MTMVAMREGKGHCDGCCDRGNNDDHGGSDETDVVCRQVVIQGRVRGPNNQPHNGRGLPSSTSN